ncbi:MAG TPA: molybdopterin converting factor subunit 1 [Humisphaera sp.]
MTVTVHLFAILRDKAGTGSCALSLPDGATVAAAAEALAGRFPALAGAVPRVAYAVNREYAGAATVLRDGDELALIPPVSGG